MLREAPGYTRIPVSPGRHEVDVAHRMRSSGIAPIFPVPIPLHSEMQAKTSVLCEARSRCGVAIDEEPPTTWSGFKMSAKPLSEDQFEQAIQGLTFTGPDRFTP